MSSYDDWVKRAKGQYTPGRDLDWSQASERLFQRVAAEKSRAAYQRRQRAVWGSSAIALAAAAAVVVFAWKPGSMGAPSTPASTRPSVVALSTTVGPTVGTLRGIEGNGDVAFDRVPQTVGALLRQNQTLNTTSASAIFERAEPSGIAYHVEAGTRASVTGSLPTLVFALESGAIEAQVQHVESGDAFAIDVGRARVAVHGTHLRVARSGNFVTVDLTEGVISLGLRNEAGGDEAREVLIAPVHAEFSADYVRETLRLDRAPAHVRMPLALHRFGENVATVAERPAVAVNGAATSPRVKTTGPLAAHDDEPTDPTTDSPPRENPTPPVPPKEPATVDPVAAITVGVQQCLASLLGPDQQNEVRVTVDTTLHLRVAPDGSVQAARFEPTIGPDAISCASAVIYKQKFATGGNKALPIRYTR